MNSTLEPPPSIAPPRPIAAVAALALAGAGVATLFLFDPAQHSFYPTCLLHTMTGLNCPGCGATRALHQLLHGHLLEAARLNLLLLLCLPFATSLALRSLAQWRKGQSAFLKIRPRTLWAFLAVSLVFMVVRNLPGFEWLAP